MVDRPVFAFEPSFFDRLPHHYDRNLDPTAQEEEETRDDYVDVYEYFHENHRPSHPIPPPHRVAQRVASTGSASSGSFWFLRKRSPKKASNSYSAALRTPSTGSLFSLPAQSLNSMNSIGSLASLNSLFLKGMTSGDSIKGMNSVDSLHGIAGIQDDSVYSEVMEEVLDGSPYSSSGLTRQVTPEEYRGSNRFQEYQVRMTKTTTSTSNTSYTSPYPPPPPPLPFAPSASAKSAAYLISLYSEAREVSSSTKIRQQQPVPSVPESTATATITQVPSCKPPSKVASLSLKSTPTKPKSKRIAAKKATKAKVSSPGATTSASPQTKKRIRRKEPVVRKFVTETENDVLLGRGGGSNHHRGNMAYRQHILSLQPEYKLLDRDAKTAMSEEVVQWVQEKQKGRFLKRESKSSPWYIVTDATARQKVSQALREDHTPEGRALKKSRTSYKAPNNKKKKSNSRGDE